MDGFLLINKETGWTSRDICNKVQSILHTKKVGHIGTLDPFATGLLVVTVGKATKAGQFLEDLPKTYFARLELGKKTSTGDLTGEVIEEKEVPQFSEDEIISIFNELRGEIKQIPPMTSAVHYKGQKLYKLAHQGIEVDREARTVNVHHIELNSFTDKKIVFTCTVSKGTYIRTLGEQIAEKLGTIGYLTFLERLSIGHLTLEPSIKVNQVNEEALLPIRFVLDAMEKVIVDKTTENKAKSGVELVFDKAINDKILLINENDDVIAVYKRKNGNTFVSARGLF